MDWLSLFLAYVGIMFSIAGLNYALFSWMRSDMKSFESEIRGWKDEINREMKDFHGRLCALEEKTKP